MTLDLLVLGLLLFFALLGAAAGGLMQLTHLAGALVGGALARPAALMLGPALAQRLGTPEIVGVLVSGVLAFFVGYGLVQWLLRKAMAQTLTNRVLSGADRAVGFALGGGKAALIIYVLLSALVFFEKPIAKVSRYHFETRGSTVATFVREHDLFTHFAVPGTAGLSALARAGADPAAAQQLANDPGFQALLHDPRIQVLVHEPDLQKALRSGDAISLLRSDRVMSLLTDAKIRDQLSAIGERLAKLPPPGDAAR